MPDLDRRTQLEMKKAMSVTTPAEDYELANMKAQSPGGAQLPINDISQGFQQGVSPWAKGYLPSTPKKGLLGGGGNE